MVKVRNHSLDTLKLICAFLVVFIHSSYPYKADILPITDVAVPLFFCISGYFVCGAERNLKRISRITQIFIWSATLYLFKTEVYHLLTANTLWIPSWQSIINFVIFNDVAFSYHLWYLPTYIYVLIIAYIIDKFSLWRFSLGMIIPLLLVGVYIKYSISDVCPKEIEYYRNAYFCGLPYFLTGALIKNTPPRHQYHTLLKVPLILTILGLFIMRYYLLGNSLLILVAREMNLLLLTVCIFFLTTICVQQHSNLFSRLGSSYSLYIYILHLMLMSICEMIAIHLPSVYNQVYMYFNPICVFILSIVVTYLLSKVKIIRL